MGAVFLDCSKCYERIPIAALYRAAVAEGFPPGLARMVCLQYQAPRFVRVAGAAAEAGRVTRGMVAGCGSVAAVVSCPALQEHKATGRRQGNQGSHLRRRSH
eukprot:1965538-Heterocapsa_arctica.AAC.1